MNSFEEIQKLLVQKADLQARYRNTKIISSKSRFASSL